MFKNKKYTVHEKDLTKYLNYYSQDFTAKNESFLENNTIFINGKFGTGKTTFIRQYMSYYYGFNNKRFNRHQTKEGVSLIHIAPWSLDTNKDFAYFFTNEILSQSKTRKILIKIALIICFLIVVKQITGYSFTDISTLFTNILNDVIDIIQNLPENVLIDIGIKISMYTLIFFLLLIGKLVIENLGYIIYLVRVSFYYFQSILRANSTKYMYGVQWQILKRELTTLYRNNRRLFIVIEDIDRLNRSAFDDLCIVVNSVNEILNDMDNCDFPSSNNRATLILSGDLEQIKIKYEMNDFEKIYQFEINMNVSTEKMRNDILSQIFAEQEGFENLELYQQMKYISYAHGESLVKFEEINELMNLDSFKKFSYRKMNRLSSELSTIKEPAIRLDRIIVRLKEMEKNVK